MLRRTNKRGPGVALQMMRCEQGLTGYAFRGEIGYGYTPMRCI